MPGGKTNRGEKTGTPAETTSHGQAVGVIGAAVAAILLLSFLPVLAQGDAPARGGRDGTTEYWWVDKIPGGPNAYKAPNRPIWRLSELKRIHAGHNEWSQSGQVNIRNP